MDRIFKYALIFSLIFHATIIIEWPIYRHLFSRQDQYKDIEITYLKIKEPQPQAPKSESFSKAYEALLKPQQPTKMVSSELPKGAQSTNTKPTASEAESKVSSETKKADAKVEKKPMVRQKSSVEISQTIIQREEGITSIDLKGQQAVLPSYAQAVRNKIKERLTAAKSEVEGNVFVRFVIASDGELKELNIIDEKSTKNGLLRELVFESIKNSAPFPSFPREFAFPEVTFTCQILFQVK